MLVTQCPRCHESVRVPDAFFAGNASSSGSARAQCPWCLETLDARELGAALPPALILVGDAAAFDATGAIGLAEIELEEQNEVEELDELDEFDVKQLDENDDTVSALDPQADDTLSTHDAEDGPAAVLPAMTFSDDEFVSESGGAAGEEFGKEAEGEKDEDFSEFLIREESAAENSRSKPPEIMMDVTQERRRRRGSPVKTVLGVAAGGLLSLPIVGTILHFTGQQIPIVSDILPAVGGSSAPRYQANTPMPYNPPVEDDVVATEDSAVTGRPIGEELAAETDGEAAVDPAAAALSELTGGTTNDFANLPDDLPADLPKIEDLDALPDPGLAALPDPGSDGSDLFSENVGDDAGDLFATDASTATSMRQPEPVPAPESVVEEVPTLNVDAEVATLRDSLEEITTMAESDPGRGEAVQTFYENVSKLAGKLPAESVGQLQGVLESISANTPLVIAFAKAAPQWIERSSEERGSDGALVVGKMSGDSPDNATILLTNKQELPVTLPASVTTVPSGIQIGLGQVEGSGRNATLRLDLIRKGP